LADLISEGNIGLIKSASRFDPSSGLKFISYAVWWIKQSMMAALNEHSRTIRIPSNLIQETQKSKRNDFSYDDPSNNVAEVMYSLPYCVDLNREINEDGDELIDIIRDPNEQSPEEIFRSSDEIRKRVSAILSVLDEREKTIIEKYFGLNGIESNLDDLGEEFNCTKERIRQLKDKAIKKLRNESYSLLNYL
jgi:RNA polymerase primary sigma factor